MKKKNIIFILADDQGAWSLGCSGNKDIITPNIDSLAQNGTKLNSFFCASPVCSPARASIITGRIPSQHGVLDWIEDSTEERKKIEYLDNQTGYVDVLSEKGYLCGLSGKWHLGASFKKQKGFTHWYAHESGSGPYYNAPMYKNGKKTIEKKYVTQAIAEDAMAFIEKNKDKPFYLQIGFTAPHAPWINNHPKEFTDLYKNCSFDSVPHLEEINPDSIYLTHEVKKNVRDNLIGYFAAVTAMDFYIGKLLNLLKKLNLDKDTIVIYTADNGFSCGQHNFWGKGNATFPINMFDVTTKVPFIISCPGFIKENVQYDNLLSAYDIRPTLLDLLDIEDKSDINLPGKSFASLITEGAMSKDSDTPIFVMDEYGPNRMIRTSEFKLVKRYPYGPDELYNLQTDPDELYNLIDSEENEEVKINLTKKLNEFYLKYVLPDFDGSKEAVYGSGQINLVGSKANGLPSFLLDDYIKEAKNYHY